MEKIEKIIDLKRDWLEYKRKNKNPTMKEWANEYLENNPDTNFELLKKELQVLIDEDIQRCMNSFNLYGNFDYVLSSVPNALLMALRNV